MEQLYAKLDSRFCWALSCIEKVAVARTGVLDQAIHQANEKNALGYNLPDKNSKPRVHSAGDYTWTTINFQQDS
ncbi:MAG: hypothetical protein OXD44_02625 [Gammaproteobacteria bacterium]|nr:hypothetical protein [Gammaproteobacteria bacterium]